MTYQLPEPEPIHKFMSVYTRQQLCDVYAAGQRDMREAAAKECFKAEDSNDEYVSTRHTIAKAINALPIETI